MIEVINMAQPYQLREGDARCDRSTKFGNPFIMYTQIQRDVVCDNYEDYLDEITKPNNEKMVRNVLRAGGLNSTQVETWMIKTGGFLDLKELIGTKRMLCWCFGKGTLVTTSKGFVPIEKVIVGDMVLSNDSKYHRVLNTMMFENVPTIKVKFQGIPEPIVCTEDHEFYVCERKRLQSNKKREIKSLPPKWIPANKLVKELNTSHMCGNIGGFPRDIYPDDTDKHTLEFWYIVGRYLGDGWVLNYKQKSRFVRSDGTKSDGYLVWITGICSSYEESDELELKIKEAGFNANKTKMPTETTFRICNKEFTIFIMQFGKYAHGKYIPGWCFNLPIEKQRALLHGIIDSDGHYEIKKQSQTITTVSKLLAFGIARLSRNVNNCQVSMSLHNFHKKPSIIKGKVIKSNYRPYVISWKMHSSIMKNTIPLDNCVWMSFRNTSNGENQNVYNLTVEDSESYIVDGVAVHNCSPHRCHCDTLKKRVELLEEPVLGIDERIG